MVILLAALLLLQGGANPQFAALQDFQQYFPVDHQRPELEHCIAMINSMIHTRDVNGLLDPEAVEERMVNLNNFGWFI